jgi:UDPglucose 6-dehydrogenase
VVTEWIAFRSPDLDLLRRELKDGAVFDGRNLYDPKALAAAGLVYHSIGRQAAVP